MDKNLRDIAYFISFCIEQYMNEKNINEDEAISIFSEHNMNTMKFYIPKVVNG